MTPEIDWIKNDPKKFNTFLDGSVFLVAIQVSTKGGPYRWDFDIVQLDCDGEGASLRYRGSGEPYDAWSWGDFEYFKLLEGEMPTYEEPE